MSWWLNGQNQHGRLIRGHVTQWAIGQMVKINMAD
jgi:hypothetical protein